MLRYLDGDVVKATAFLDTDIEHELLEEYIACMNDHGAEGGLLELKRQSSFMAACFVNSKKIWVY